MSKAWLDFYTTLAIDSSSRAIANSAIYPLINKQILTVEGQDAQTFLQGQVTCDVDKISLEYSLIGSHNSPKGRMISSFRLFSQTKNQYHLSLDKSLTEKALSAFKKYIVFSKADIKDNQGMVGIGLHGPQAKENLKKIFTSLPDATCKQITYNDMVLLCTDTELPAFELYLDANKAIDIWPSLCTSLPISSTDQQLLIEHKNGLGFITGETTELFIPQMLNYQSISAISFTKGCYTGQEIIARMKYLGKLKRLMYHHRVTGVDSIDPGNSISLESHSKNIGNIVSAIKVDSEEWDILVVLTDEAAAKDSLFINEKLFNISQKIALPYPIDEDE